MSKIAIGVNYFSPSVGGCEVVTGRIAEFLSEENEVHIFTRRLPNRVSSQYGKTEIHEYSPMDKLGFVNSIDKLKPDLLFIYSDVFDFLPEVLLSKSRTKVVLAMCGANRLSEHRIFARLLTRNLHKIDAFICHGTVDRDYRFCDVDGIREKCHIIRNAVDLEEFDQCDLERKQISPEDEGRRWILNISNFFPGKGQEHIPSILTDVVSDRDLTYFQVCADTPLPVSPSLEHRWKVQCKRVLGDRVRYKLIKNPEREVLIGLLKNSNLFLFASEKEVAPLVVLEAMAARLPWVSMDVGNVSELEGGIVVTAAKDSRYHSILDSRVKQEMIQACPKAWSNNGLRVEGRDQIESFMTWDKVLPQYKMVFESVL